MTFKLMGVLLIAAWVGGITVAFAQQRPATAKFDLGKAEYESKCATCHGVTGKGDGPVASFLNRKASDLTTLAKNNTGVLPVAAILPIVMVSTETAAMIDRR